MRQAELFKNYGFHCDCRLCCTGSTSFGEVDQFIDDPLALRLFLKSIKRSDEVSRALSMDEYVTAINDATVSSPSSAPSFDSTYHLYNRKPRVKSFYRTSRCSTKLL